MGTDFSSTVMINDNLSEIGWKLESLNTLSSRPISDLTIYCVREAMTTSICELMKHILLN